MSNWKSSYLQVKFSPEQLATMKMQYAKLLARHNRNRDLAFADPEMDIIFFYDVSAKLEANTNWALDHTVLAEANRLLTKDVADILPTKEHIAKLVFDTAMQADGKERIEGLMEYSEIMGFTKNKGDVGGGSTHNVILVTDNGDSMTWEEKMKRQQHELALKAESMLNGD